MPDLTKEEFCQQFEAHMLKVAPHDAEGRPSLIRYAKQAAVAAWEQPEQREEGPDACVEADISYWEE